MRSPSPAPQACCVLIASLVVLCASCATKHPKNAGHAHLVDCPKVVPSADLNADNCIFDWQQNGPLEFLAFLQSSDPESTEGACWVTCKHVGWVKREDVPKLIGLLNSQATCRKVYASRLSPVTGGLPKVGYEALVMLESYQAGYYPALSKEEEPFDQRRDAFLAWWQKQNAERPS